MSMTWFSAINLLDLTCVITYALCVIAEWGNISGYVWRWISWNDGELCCSWHYTV